MRSLLNRVQVLFHHTRGHCNNSSYSHQTLQVKTQGNNDDIRNNDNGDKRKYQNINSNMNEREHKHLTKRCIDVIDGGQEVNFWCSR